MKRITISLALALLVHSVAVAQDITYALPSTTLTVKVEVEQENFIAGPYANFARQFLNMEVRDHDAVSSIITSVEIIPRIEADNKALYTCEADNAALLSLSAQGLVALQAPSAATASQAWRFLPPVGSDFSGSITSPNKEETRTTYKTIPSEEAPVQVPIEQKVKSAKSPEDLAAEAAENILSIRKVRVNIVAGDTDASYSGEAMAAAIRELDRMEQEYLALFQGTSTKRRYTASFDVIPDASLSAHRYLAFRLKNDGPVTDGKTGTPYYIELEPEKVVLPADAGKSKSKVEPLHYRIPAVCRVRFTRDGQRLLETRLPVYQLGTEVQYISK